MKIVPWISILALAAAFQGCAAVVASSPARESVAVAVKVSIVNPFASVAAGAAPILITAEVLNDSSHSGVAWSLVAGDENCAPACGSLTPIKSPSFSAKYTPPTTLPIAPNKEPSIIAKSVADEKKSDRFHFSIHSSSPFSVTLSGAFSSVVSAGPTQSLSAVTNDPQGVLWSLTANGIGCAPLCGALTFSSGQHLLATYTPPPILAAGAPASATISAAALSDTTKSASFQFAIQAATTSSYAILLRGYDSSGVPMAIAGSLLTNQSGTITDGELDINLGGAVTHAAGLQGTFGTDTDFAGIIRGTLTLTNVTLPGTNVNPSFKFALRGNELEGRLIEFDGAGNLNAGVVLLQSGLSSTVPAGVYAFGLDSDAPLGSRTVSAGAFAISQGGSVSGVTDRIQAGATAPLKAVPLNGAAIAPDALGRGTVTLSVGGVATDFAYYFVNAGLLNLIQLGSGSLPTTVFAGSARLRAESFDPATAPFHPGIFQVTGAETPAGSSGVAPDASIGFLSISNTGDAQLAFDSNYAGALFLHQERSANLASYDSVTGRGELSIPGGAQNGLLDSLAVYFYDNGEGFVIESNSNNGAAYRAASGTLSRQLTADVDPPFVAGPLLALSGGSSSAAIPNVIAALNADPSSGSLAGIAYATSFPAQAGQSSNVSFTGSYQFEDPLEDPLTGRGTAMLPGGFYGDFTSQSTAPAVFYVVNSNRFVSIGTKPGTASGVTLFDPD